MKKSILTCAVFLLVCGAQAVHAETDRDWAVSGYVGIVDYETEEKPDPFQPIMREITSDNAYKFGVIASKYYKDFSFNVGIEFLQEVDTYADEVKAGEHSHVPVFLGVNYHYDTTFIDPYIGVGFGYSFNDASVSEFISDQGITAEVDDSTFYFLTAGVDYPLSDRYSLFLSGQYTVGDVEGTGTMQTPQGTIQIEDEGTLDRYEFNLGIRYFF